MPNPRISFECQVDDVCQIGIMVRTTTAVDGTKKMHLLSRDAGLWVLITPEQLQEHEIPMECIFPIDELPGVYGVSGN